MYHMLMQSNDAMRLCCIDFGLKRIGIALSNPSKTIATRLVCLENKGYKTTAIFFEKAIEKHKIEGFIIGWPAFLDGSESKQCKLVDNFCKKLFDSFGLPITKHIETYSTKECQAILKTSKVTDDVVATKLLQDFLENMLNS